MVVAAPTAGVKTNVLRLSALVHALVSQRQFRQRIAVHRQSAPPLWLMPSPNNRRAPAHLVANRLRDLNERRQRGDAGVGGLEDLHAVANAVEKVADVVGAVIEPRRGEELVGLSSAVLTFYRSRGHSASWRAVGRRLKREKVLRTDAERTMSDMCQAFLMIVRSSTSAPLN